MLRVSYEMVLLRMIFSSAEMGGVRGGERGNTEGQDEGGATVGPPSVAVGSSVCACGKKR